MYVMENGAKFLEEDEFLNLSEDFFENELNGLLRAEALLSIFVTLSASEDRKRYHVFSEKWRQKGKYWTQKDMYRKEYKNFLQKLTKILSTSIFSVRSSFLKIQI